MFSQEFHDLSRPQVLNILEKIKTSGGSPIAQIAQELDISYMGAKQHCEKLVKLGYLDTWRVPRAAAGRPEKLYVLTDKCDEMFPQAGVELSLELLASVKRLFGENAPDRLLFQYFESLRDSWKKSVHRGKSIVERATRLSELRQKYGCFSRCHYSPETGFRLEEYHHPMKRIFEQYPSAIMMEVRMLEQVLGTKVRRKEIQIKGGNPNVVYEIMTLG